MSYDITKASQLIARWEHGREPDQSAVAEAALALFEAVKEVVGKAKSISAIMERRALLIGANALAQVTIAERGREIHLSAPDARPERIPVSYDAGLKAFVGDDEDTEVTVVPGQARPKKDAAVVVLDMALNRLGRLLDS